MAITPRRCRKGIVGIRFVRRRHHGCGAVHPGHQLREGIAEQSGNAQGHIHPRPAQLPQGDQFQVDQPPAGAIPDRPHPEQR